MLASLTIMTLDDVTQICRRYNRTNVLTTQLVFIISLDILQTKNAFVFVELASSQLLYLSVACRFLCSSNQKDDRHQAQLN